MSIESEMLEAARRGGRLLGKPLAGMESFLLGRICDDGGFASPAGSTDLYYTMFGIESMAAIGVGVPGEKLRPYLDAFGTGDTLDLVHLACLVRCLRQLEKKGTRCQLGGRLPACTSRAKHKPAGLAVKAPRLAENIEKFRAEGGGYSHLPACGPATAYGCFLAAGAYQDLGLEIPRPGGIAAKIGGMLREDGSYGNVTTAAGTTPSTAAAVTALAALGQRPPDKTARWLLERRCNEGGFTAAAGLPQPDLLSTAVTLHALWVIGGPSGPDDKTRAFVLDHRTEGGGFHGGPGSVEDCEYTFYGLLALGHLGGS